MNTLLLLIKNLFSRPVTVRFPAAPPVRSGYRGLVEYDATKCTGCGMCAFRCTSRAIVFRSGKTDFKWSYDPAQCTFCARCIDGCEAGALTMAAECPPVYLAAGALKRAYVTPRQRPTPPAQPAAPAAPALPGTAPAPGEAK
ncbi:MAG TPA: 4Fe-4S dicluster domain-containing protein [Terracidiphilus sp.]|nr:4Fe-4S dicluster domain-containing protein [Terracidiphilus sp.]